MIILIVFIVVLETGQFYVVLAFYVSKTKFACMHAYTKQFGSIAHVSGFRSERHENFDGFHKTSCGFLSNPKLKLKLPSLVISRPVRFLCVQNTSSSDVHG